MRTSNGSFQIFRLFGITVYLHWSWLVYAAWRIYASTNSAFQHYRNPVWYAVEFGSIFAIVLMHEFGHSLACRSVGGHADTIMLWPLGGVAFVDPPMRPGAVLWSIFAGPMVNMILIPITVFGYALIDRTAPGTDLAAYAWSITVINAVLLIFNMLPIYPLDGGQILQSLLWFVLGYIRSLKIVSIIGLLGAAGGTIFLLANGVTGIMLYILIMFVALQAWNGFRRAQMMADAEQRGPHINPGRPTERANPASSPPPLRPLPPRQDQFRAPPGF